MDHGPDIGRDVDVDREAGISGTEIHSSPIINDPPTALGLRNVGEIEFNRHTSRPEDTRIDASADIPCEDRDVEVALPERVLRVAEPPFAKMLDDWRKRAAGRRKKPFGSSGIGAAALNDADALQLLQSFG